MEIQVKFHCIDDWNRPVYKSLNSKVLIGSLDILFPNKKIAPNNTIKEINNYFKNNTDKLVVFGTNVDDDPLGTKIRDSVKIRIID